MINLKYIAALITLMLTPFVQADSKLELPSMEYVTSLMEDESHFTKLKDTTLFKNIEKDLQGAPLRLFAMIHAQSTQGGSASEISSGLLAATTLGIIPVVKNQDIVMSYRIRLNNNTLTEYSYTKNVTDVVSMYNQNQQQNFDKETKAWIASTIDMFIKDIEQDEKVKAFIEEYHYYFGEEQKATE